MKYVKWSIILGLTTLLVSYAASIAARHTLTSSVNLWLGLIIVALVYPLAWLGTHRWLIRKGVAASLTRTALSFMSGLLPLVINLPYLWYYSGFTSVTEVPYLSIRSILIVEILLGATLVTLFLIAPTGLVKARLWSPIEAHPLKTLIAITAIWTGAATVLSILFHYYMHEWGPNTTLAVQALNNPFDQRGFFYASVAQAQGASLLGAHANLVFFPIVPLFKILPRFETVLAISQLAMAMAAFPLYFLARTRLTKGQSLIVALAYLAHPTIASATGIQGMSELRFFPLPFFASLYFFEKKRYLPFALSSILAMSTREDVAILYALLGLYALVRRQNWQWTAVPIIVGIGWFLFASQVLIPAANPQGEFTRMQVVYEEYGGSQWELVNYLAMHPWTLVTKIIGNASNIGLVYGLFVTTGLGIPLLSGLVMLAAPGLAENLLIDKPNIHAHHVIIIAAPLLAAFVFGAAKLNYWTRRLKGAVNNSVSGVAVTLLLFACLSVFHIWYAPDRFLPRYNYDAAVEALEFLPEDASVMLPLYMLVRAKKTQAPAGYYQVAYRTDLGLEILQEDYIIIDRVVPGELKETRLFQGLSQLENALEASDDYDLVYKRDDLELYARKEKRGNPGDGR